MNRAGDIEAAFWGAMRPADRVMAWARMVVYDRQGFDNEPSLCAAMLADSIGAPTDGAKINTPHPDLWPEPYASRLGAALSPRG